MLKTIYAWDKLYSNGATDTPFTPVPFRTDQSPSFLIETVINEEYVTEASLVVGGTITVTYKKEATVTFSQQHLMYTYDNLLFFIY